MKRRMPCCFSSVFFLGELLLFVMVLYVFFLVVQLALFNLVIIGILLVWLKKFWNLLETCRKSCNFDYKTKEFRKYIKIQNAEVYKDMQIQLDPEPEGKWLEFNLQMDEQMFEKVIQLRRERIFRENNSNDIEEMKKILEEYKAKREQQAI